MSREPKTTSSTLGPAGGFCDGLGVELADVDVPLVEATSGAIGVVAALVGDVWGGGRDVLRLDASSDVSVARKHVRW